uniref:Myosin IXA n=1 Tax=Nothobranchius furzeri TaxID=105023 RepID=A0A8C6KY96_NOTFU
MEMVGFLPATCKQIFSLLSAILHLGNIRYKRKTYRDDSIDICNPEVLPVVSELLEVKEEMLFEALTTRKTVTVGEKLIVPYKLAEAGTVRDSMAKSLYGALFDWIVFRINHALLNIKDLEETTKILSIGVLDIFGFEDYESNSFEQFCINFANERLQHYFNQHIFKLEQEEYRAEDITWRNIDYIDNTGCINLISKKPTALFHLLDEECNFPQATNQTLLDKFKRQHERNSYIEFPAVMEPAFIIRHYAGKVKYGVKDFREKNTDHMRPDIVALLKSSKNAFICGLIGIDPSATFRWAVLRAYFRALVAFREAGKRHTHKKIGHDDAAPCAVLKKVDSFSFLQHPVHQRSLEILQRCKEEKYSKAAKKISIPPLFMLDLMKSPRAPLSDIQGMCVCACMNSPGLGWNGRVGRRSCSSSSSSTAEDDGIFVNSASSKLLEKAHDILMRNKNYKSKPVLPKHLLNVKSLKYLSNLTLHDRITKSLLHLHKKKKPPSISAQFQASLNKLMETLGQSEPYFVKCIRSNADKLPLRFDDDLVLRQLRYTGMLETVRIRQSGYNVKYNFKDFVHHFSVLLPEGTKATRESIQECLDHLDLQSEGFQVGKTKVFLQEAERQQLQASLHREVLRLIVLLQREFRARLERKQFVRMREAAISIQRFCEYNSGRVQDAAGQECYDPRVEEEAALCLQTHWRGYIVRRSLKQQRLAALVLQRAWRSWFCRRCSAALVVQTAWRCHRAREAYVRRRCAVIQLQAFSRGFLARQSFAKLREQRRREEEAQRHEKLLQPDEKEEDKEEDDDHSRATESSSRAETEFNISVPTSTTVVQERMRTVDELSQKTTRAKRENRRLRELEQAQFSLELLKVRANSGGASSPSEERRWSLELVGPTSPPVHSSLGTPDSQSSKGSFELLTMDEEPPRAPEEVMDSDDLLSPVSPITSFSDSNIEVVPSGPKNTEPDRTRPSDTVPRTSQSPTKVDLSAPQHPPKMDNYLPTFYVPAHEDSTAVSHHQAEEPQRNKTGAVSTTTSDILKPFKERRESARRPVESAPAVLEKLVRLNEKKEERQRSQHQQNEKEMMEQIRKQKEALEQQRLFFVQYEKEMFEKQRGEALERIQQSRQGGQDLTRTASSVKTPRPSSLLIERTQQVPHSRTQSDSTPPPLHSPPAEDSSGHLPKLPPPPSSAPTERRKDRPATEGWAPKLVLESRAGAGTREKTTSKKAASQPGSSVGTKDKPGSIFFSPHDKEMFTS